MFDYKKIFSSSLEASVASTNGRLVQGEEGYQKFIKLIILHNINTTTETIELFYVPTDASVAAETRDSHKIWQLELSADETMMLEMPVPGIILDEADCYLKGKSTTTDKVSIQIYGGVE